MTRREEWDWPPRRRRGYFRAYRTFDVAKPYGTNSLGQKIARVYIRVMWTIFKIAVAIPVTILTVGSIWLLGFLLTLYL
jgi:hypothetical protein